MRKGQMAFWTAAFLLLLATIDSSCAGVRISGTTDRLLLEVQEDSLSDILSAVQRSFNLDIRVKGAATQQFTGTYRGSLRTVLRRVLHGTDYTLDLSETSLRIVLVGTSAKTIFMRAAAGDDISSNDATLGILAAAAASPGGGGSRLTRIRQQRARMRSAH